VWVLADRLSASASAYVPIVVWNGVARLLIFVFAALVVRALGRAAKRARDLQRNDPLTGLLNTHTFMETVHAEVKRSQRYGRPLTIAYLDLDNFKLVNERYGRSLANDLLRKVAATLALGIRRSDVVGRVGDDEFAMMFPETGGEGGKQVLERVREKVVGAIGSGECPATVCIAAASYSIPPRDTQELIRRVDTLMYAVKSDGKGRMRHIVFQGDKIAKTELDKPQSGSSRRGTSVTPPADQDASPGSEADS
jgi:diguanylate cyclase (GGDEF)-like protein